MTRTAVLFPCRSNQIYLYTTLLASVQLVKGTRVCTLFGCLLACLLGATTVVPKLFSIWRQRPPARVLYRSLVSIVAATTAKVQAPLLLLSKPSVPGSMADARNVMTPAAAAVWTNGNNGDLNRLSPPSSSSSPHSSSKSSSGSSRNGNKTTHQQHQPPRRFLQVLPFRASAVPHDHPRSGTRRRPRLLTEETWWVLHNPLAQQASADHHRSNINHSDDDNNKHPSASLDQYTDPTHPNRTAGIFGRMRIRSVGHVADITTYYQRGSPPESGVEKPLKEEQADNTTGTGADDNASAASSKMSTLSNVSERRIQWNPLPVGPTVGAMDAALHNHAPMEDSRFQFTSVPLEIFVPIRSNASSNSVPEWLKISSRSLGHSPRRKNDEWLDDSEDDEGPSEHHPAEHSPITPSSPPPPPESPPSPLQQLLLPRLAPLVTTEPSPSIPRPTLGKHSQSAPVADLFRGQRRQFPPVTPTSASNLARPQSLHQITNPRCRPQSMATGPRDGSLSFRSAYSSCAMSMASSTANASQLSDADQKLLGGRERYRRNSSARFQKSSSSSVLTLSVGSLVGQSSWVTAPGMTVATSSGSFEPASGGGSPRSRRTALTSAADDNDDDNGKVRNGLVAVSLQEGSHEDADGINCGPVEHRRRVSVLHFSGGGGGAVVVSRWMDRGVAWMSSTTRHVRRCPKLPSPPVRVDTKGGSDAAVPTSHPDLQRSSGCLT
jgi:hypothetical protein